MSLHQVRTVATVATVAVGRFATAYHLPSCSTMSTETLLAASILCVQTLGVLDVRRLPSVTVAM